MALMEVYVTLVFTTKPQFGVKTTRNIKARLGGENKDTT